MHSYLVCHRLPRRPHGSCAKLQTLPSELDRPIRRASNGLLLLPRRGDTTFAEHNHDHWLLPLAASQYGVPKRLLHELRTAGPCRLRPGICGAACQIHPAPPAGLLESVGVLTVWTTAVLSAFSPNIDSHTWSRSFRAVRSAAVLGGSDVRQSQNSSDPGDRSGILCCVGRTVILVLETQLRAVLCRPLCGTGSLRSDDLSRVWCRTHGKSRI